MRIGKKLISEHMKNNTSKMIHEVVEIGKRWKKYFKETLNTDKVKEN